MAAGGEWFFRNTDGNVYGPADFESLAVWAREGRITPTGFLSRDRREWIPAPDLPELGMVWLVEAEPRKWYGPFHRDVVEGLKAKGSLAEGSRIYKLCTKGIEDATEKVVEKEVVKVVEKRVEVPVEKVVVKEVKVEVPVEKIVEKRVEIPVEKIVEKEIRVEVPVEKIVEREVVKIVEKRVEVPVEKVVVKEVKVEVPVEKTVIKEVKVEVPVEKIVEKRVEVPVEVEKVVEKIVEVPVEKVVEKIVEVPVERESAQPGGGFGGIFKGADRSSMAALEAAARREIFAAKRNGGGFDIFGRRK